VYKRQVHGREALVGAWQLLSWENRAADGQVTLVGRRRRQATASRSGP
jgi:hypothetical protein